MRGRDIQRCEWLSDMYVMFSWEIFDVFRTDVRHNVPCLSFELVFVIWQLAAVQLHVQFWFHWNQWWILHCLLTGHLQGCEWLSGMHYVLGRKVQQ